MAEKPDNMGIEHRRLDIGPEKLAFERHHLTGNFKMPD